MYSYAIWKNMSFFIDFKEHSSSGLVPFWSSSSLVHFFTKLHYRNHIAMKSLNGEINT